MALSGSFGTNFSGGYRLQIDWYATQNIANNTSTVRADLYLISLGSSWTISSSASKNVSLTVNGNFSGNSLSGLAGLSGNQKKFIFWHEVVVPHNTDGTKSLDIRGVLDIKVSLNNSWVESVNTSQTVTLDTIPRKSTLTSTPSMTAGYNLAVSINRASSNFQHVCIFYVKDTAGAWQTIKQINPVETSANFDFTDAENEKIFQALGRRKTCESSVRVQTYNYGTYDLGYNDYYGTVTNDGGGVVTFNSFNIGDRLPINISNNPKLKHTVKFYFGGTLIKTLNNVNAGASNVDWSASEINAMLAKIPNSTSGSGEAYVTSYWGSTQVWSDIASGYTAYTGSKARPPIFSGGFTYKDTNGTTTGITGNNQYVIQNKSTVSVELLIANRATAQDYATMKEYIATLNGVEVRVPHSDTATMTFNFGTVSAGANSTLTVKAVDSRGFITATTKTVNILPYQNPTITSDVTRRNNFETPTTIPCSGTMSDLNVAGSKKNAVTSVQYRYKETIGGTFVAWKNFAFTSTAPTYSTTTITENLDNTKAWTLEIKVVDKLGTTTVTRTVTAGSPIFFIDWEKKTLGINKFPTSASNALEIAGHVDVDGQIKLKASQYISSGAGLQLNNSDISGANCIYFGDETTGGEGLNFPLTGKSGSINSADYDTLAMLDGQLRINDKSIFTVFAGTSNFRLTGDMYSSATGGVIIDVWGNIKGQPTAVASNTWSIKDADDRVKFLTPIGKGATGSTDIHAHTGGIKLYHNNINSWNFWQSGGGAYCHMDMGGGRFKWNGDNATFEFLGINGGWAKVYGDWNSSSTRAVKKNIEVYDDSALTLINSAPTYQYHYLNDEDNRKKRLGLIVEESPHTVVSDDEKSIEMYSMTTLLWKAVQELSAKVDNLEKRITMR